MKPLTILTLLSAAFASTAIAEDKHVHGEAELFIAMENNKLLVEMTTPANNILGFEHEPQTEAQHKLFDDALKELTHPEYLITFSGGKCKLADTDIDSPFEEEHHDEHEHDHHDHDKDEHDHHDHDKHDKEDHDDHEHDHHDEEHHEHEEHDDHDHDEHEHGEHSDFEVSYTYTCKDINSVSNATITAFEHFAGFEEIHVFWVAGDKSGSKETTKSDNTVKF